MVFNDWNKFNFDKLIDDCGYIDVLNNGGDVLFELFDFSFIVVEPLNFGLLTLLNSDEYVASLCVEEGTDALGDDVLSLIIPRI